MLRLTLLLTAAVLIVPHTAHAQDRSRMVSGRVFDDSTGCPLRAAQLSSGEGAAHALTDANGRYRLYNPPTGAFTLQVMLRGYETQGSNGVVVSDSSSRVDFSLARSMGDTVKVIYPKKVCRLEPKDSSGGVR